MNAAKRMLRLAGAVAEVLGVELKTNDEKRRAVFALSIAVDLLSMDVGVDEDARAAAVEGLALMDGLYDQTEARLVDLYVPDVAQGVEPEATTAAPRQEAIGDIEAVRIVEEQIRKSQAVAGQA